MANRWSGLVERAGQVDIGGPSYSEEMAQQNSAAPIDKPYLVRETWIFPHSPFLKRLWGKQGALVMTVGGILAKKEPLPQWALKACPFIQLLDTPEEGNHYGKAPLRDLGLSRRSRTVAIGAPGTPTPTGRFGVTDRLTMSGTTSSCW